MTPLLKTIKKSAFTLVLLAAPVLAFSQKLEKPTIDKFSNDTTVTTTTEKIATTEKFSSTTASMVYAYTGKLKGISYINLQLEVSDDQPYFSLPQGKKVMLKLTDNSSIQLVNDTDQIAIYRTLKSGFVQRTYWIVSQNYIISHEDMSKFLSSDVTVIRFETNGNNIDFDVTSKEAAVIKKLFALISGAAK